MPLNKGYIKYKHYIVTIDVINDLDVDWMIDEPHYATYITSNYNVVSIDSIVYTPNTHYIVGNTYTNKIYWYKSRELVFNINFIEDKQWELFPNGYSGVYKEYHYNGQLELEYFHINGIIEGIYKHYHYKGMIYLLCSFTNGVLEGEYKKYFTDGIINVYCTYVNGVIKGDKIIHGPDGI